MYLPGQVDQPISAAQAVASFHQYSSLRLFRGRVYGVRYDADKGINQLCRFESRHAVSLLPERFSVRSRVHSYGGGAWCRGRDQAYFVNDADQHIWVASLSGSVSPRQLTAYNSTRMADLQYDAQRHRLILVCETRSDTEDEPANYLGSVSEAGRLTVLAEGADFYSSPTLSPQGDQLAWIEWDHPFQPWDCTRLMLARVDASGRLENIRQVSDIPAAWAQPRFSPQGVLHAVVDRGNWWVIEQLSDQGFIPVAGEVPLNTEFTTAPWQFGLSTYGWGDDGELLAIGQSNGYSTLFMHDGKEWQKLHLDQPAARLHSLALGDGHCCCIGEFTNRMPAILHLCVDGKSATTTSATLTGGDTPDYSVALPESCQATLSDGGTVPYFLYRPAQESGGPLPLIIYTHGGPTAMTSPSFRPAIQYWTQRGFIIADVNYRGSTGFGRDYRMGLAGRWGISDVEDVEAVANALVNEGLVDPRALFIRGNSAGGYTTLSALAHSDLFTAGASLYGVSDPRRLNALTHKFESRYLHWLIGDPALESSRYSERSPLDNVDKIQAPVIFFQGDEDPVVLPEQTRSMAESLRQRAIRVEEYHFAGEGHGFRNASNQVEVLERELCFYRRQINQNR
ncbi:prolyl oligopeptidase family serine peptidase [Marinobacterium sp. YM272]|uniref:alpha/beta hydrolase family protein n=1 Tax=Marinobacterium sp. YM272 TaxID=3421654 RepID=UPI003D7F3997